MPLANLKFVTLQIISTVAEQKSAEQARELL
jgi:hypothetical protein